MKDEEKDSRWQLFRILSISMDGSVEPVDDVPNDHCYFVGKLPPNKNGAFTDCPHLCSGDRPGENVKVPLTFNAGMFVQDDGSIGLRLHFDNHGWDEAMRRFHLSPDPDANTIIFGYKVSPDEIRALRN